MAIKITKSTDPISVDKLMLVVYGNPGVGKTSMAFTANKPLLLNFDAERVSKAQWRKDVVTVSAWSEVEQIEKDDLGNYSTLIIDPAGAALESLAQAIMDENPKMRNGVQLSLQGFGALKARFSAFIKRVFGWGLDVVVLAHAASDKSGDTKSYTLDAQGASREMLQKDSLGLAFMESKGKGNSGVLQSVLHFTPDASWNAKDPCGLGDITYEHDDSTETFLADLIAKIKTDLTKRNQGDADEAREHSDFVAKIEQSTTLEQFNGLIEALKSLPESRRKMAWSKLKGDAKSFGFTYDTKAKQFAYQDQKAE